MCHPTLLAPSRYERRIHVICVPHLKNLRAYGVAWNTGTCLYMIWTGLGCLIQFVNSIVWNKNTTNRAPVYCDICKSLDALSLGHTLTVHHPTATRVQVALNVAIPACSLCINRRLYKIATVKNVMNTRADKRRAVIQDLLICVGLPVLQIISREYDLPFNIGRSLIKFRVHYLEESLQYI